MLSTLFGLVPVLQGAGNPRCRWRPPSEDLNRDLDHEIRVEMLVRRISDTRPPLQIDHATDRRLRVLLSR